MPVDAVPPAGNPCHTCPTLCPTVALDLEGVPPCVDVRGKRKRPVHLERALRLCARLRRDSRAYWRKYNMEFDVELKRAYVRDAINSAWMARKIYREVVKS